MAEEHNDFFEIEASPEIYLQGDALVLHFVNSRTFNPEKKSYLSEDKKSPYEWYFQLYHFGLEITADISQIYITGGGLTGRSFDSAMVASTFDDFDQGMITRARTMHHNANSDEYQHERGKVFFRDGFVTVPVAIPSKRSIFIFTINPVSRTVTLSAQLDEQGSSLARFQIDDLSPKGQAYANDLLRRADMAMRQRGKKPLWTP